MVILNRAINAISLFIDNRILEYNTIFRTTPFDREAHFVYLLQNLECLHALGADAISVDPSFEEHSLAFS